MLDLTKNYCYDPVLRYQLKLLYKNVDLHKIPNKDFVYMNLSAILQVFINKIEIGFGTIDLVDRLLSLFKGKTLTSIGPHWAGIKWACEKNNVKFDDENGDIAYIARPNGRDGLLRKVPFDDFEFVIIDEAYGDFCDESYIQYDHTNSIVLKTFSKSLSLPGIRFACSVSSPEIALRLQRLSHSYSMNGIVQDIIPAAFYMIKPHVSRMKDTKKFLESKFKHLPSHANFVKMIDPPPYKVKVSKIEDYYRFTLIGLHELQRLETKYN